MAGKKKGKKAPVKKTPAKKSKKDEAEEEEDEAEQQEGGEGEAGEESEEESSEESEDDQRRGKKKKRGRREGGKSKRKVLGKNTVVMFMTALIPIELGDDGIPEESRDMAKAAQRIRQMAEKLARQTLRHGEGDVVIGGESGEEEEDSED